MSNFNKKRSATLAGFLALSLFTLSAFPAAGAPTYTLQITVRLFPDTFFSTPEAIDSPDDEVYEPNYRDLAAVQYACKNDTDLGVLIGSSVKVTNESGKLVGVSRISKCTHLQDSNGSINFIYIFYSTVKISSAKFYNVSVNKIEGPDYSFSELKKKKWRATLEIKCNEYRCQSDNW